MTKAKDPKKEAKKELGLEENKPEEKKEDEYMGDNGFLGLVYRGSVIISDKNKIIDGVKRVLINNSSERFILSDEELKELKNIKKNKKRKKAA